MSGKPNVVELARRVRNEVEAAREVIEDTAFSEDLDTLARYVLAVLPVVEAARGRAIIEGEVMDLYIEYMRECGWNTNAAVLQHHRDKLRDALARLDEEWEV